MLIPYSVDAPMSRWPLANWALIALTSLVSLWVLAEGELQDWNVIGPGEHFTSDGLLGSMVTHADLLHLIGNMVFLFVFGNAVNAKLGHIRYLVCYAVCGAIAGLGWALLADGPAAGASGAIMGVLGMLVVFYPRNEIWIYYWLGGNPYGQFGWHGTFGLPGVLVIGAYFAMDVYFFATGDEGGVAYLAHIVGFLAGFAIASALVLLRMVALDETEENLYETLGVITQD